MQHQFETVHHYIVDVVNSPLVPLVWQKRLWPDFMEAMPQSGCILFQPSDILRVKHRANKHTERQSIKCLEIKEKCKWLLTKVEHRRLCWYKNLASLSYSQWIQSTLQTTKEKRKLKLVSPPYIIYIKFSVCVFSLVVWRVLWIHWE